MSILAQENPVFQKAMRVISNVTNANPAVVTTTFDHDYIDGMIVRLNIAPGYGMLQASQLQGVISIIDDTSFSITVDTLAFDIFAAPVAYPKNMQYCQVTPIGQVSSTLAASTRNVLPYSAI